LAGGAGASIAFADSPLTGEDSVGKHVSGEKPKSDPDDKKATPGGGREAENGKGADVQPGDEKQGADGEKNGDNNNGGNGDPSTPPTTPTTTPTKEEPPPTPGWPWPWNPGEPPAPGGGGGGGGHPDVPSGRPGVPAQMQLPPELMPPTTGPVGPTVVDVEPGVGIAAAQLPIAPITLPVIVAPATGLGGGGGSPGAPALPVTPRGVTAEPPAGREPLPANVGSNVAPPATSYRIGYTEYLRSAGLSQVAALAVPGLAGMLVLTGAGALVGYRQAKGGHAVHTSGNARFVN
jgi:hypothetical protein